MAITEGQPNLPGLMQFGCDTTGAASPGLPPSSVIKNGQPVFLTTRVQIDGNPLVSPILAAALNGAGVEVKYHIQNLHTGAMQHVNGGAAGPIGNAPGSFVDVVSPPILLGLTPAGATETPYRVLTTVQAGGALAGTVAGFDDGLILMVTV